MVFELGDSCPPEYSVVLVILMSRLTSEEVPSAPREGLRFQPAIMSKHPMRGDTTMEREQRTDRITVPRTLPATMFTTRTAKGSAR